MRKIRFFLDPMSDIKIWLNKMSEDGYRLMGVKKFLYEFEKSDEKYYYDTQFIGNNSPKDNINYIEMLKQSDKNIFRAPINQGNISYGKIRFRPFAEGAGKWATSFMDFNKELLIVESSIKEELFTDYRDMALQYKKNRNGYLQGWLILMILFILSAVNLFNTSGTKEMFLFIIILIILLWLSWLTVKNHKNYRKYDQLSNLQER